MVGELAILCGHIIADSRFSYDRLENNKKIFFSGLSRA